MIEMIVQSFFSGLGSTVFVELMNLRREKKKAELRALIRSELEDFLRSSPSISITNTDELAEKIARQIEAGNVLAYGKEIAIRTCNGTYVGADLNEGGKLFARVYHVREWEIFEIVDAFDPFSPSSKRPIRYGDKVTLKAKNNNHFVGAQFHSQNELVARVDWVKEWEIFTLLPPPASMSVERNKAAQYGSSFTLQADNGMFVGCRFHLDSSLAAVAPDAKEWETFVFINPARFRFPAE